MGEIPQSEKMFHLPIEISVYVPSTKDVDKVISKSEMKLRVDEVKKYLATLFGGFSSSSVEGGFLASDGKVVQEDVERVVSFAPKEEFEKNKEALVQKASEWATKWGQEAIGLEHEGDLYYVPQKFENGGTIAIREAKEMANSQAIKIKHHVTELANILKSNPTIEAWVIAKLESASNDLADVTHYLDGRVQMEGKKMATGGSVGDKTVKVKAVYLEQQYFELTKEIEIPFTDYKEYEKTGKVSRELENDLMSETTTDHWVETNAISVRLTPITGNKMAKGGQTQAQQNKIAKVMGEFKDRKLHSSSGDLVTDRKQAIAIALSEAGVERKMAEGGSIHDEDFDGSGQLSLKVDNEEVAKLNYDYDLESTLSEDLNGYKNEFYISNVETKKEFRGKGYAKQLIRQAIAKAKKLGIELISLRRDSGAGCNYGSEYDDYLKKIYESIGFVEKNNDCVMILETEKYAEGGSIDPTSMEVQFIKYKDEEIMYEPHFKEFYVNDSMFNSLEEAKYFIDKGAPISDELKEAYRKGLFAKGGNMEFKRPSYKSNYVASQAQTDEFSDENWNMDYENDPLIKAKRKIKENAERAVMAYATRGTSEIARKAQESKDSTPNQMSSADISQIAGMMGGMKK